MFAYILNDAFQYFIAQGTPFEIDGNSYPANWLNLSTPEEKAAVGIVDVIDYGRPDDRYYWVSQDAPIIGEDAIYVTYTKTPKDLAALKDQAIEQVNQAAGSILAPSDYMVIKATESGKPIDANWSLWRERIRSQARSQKAAITACTTVDQLAALPQVDWSKSP